MLYESEVFGASAAGVNDEGIGEPGVEDRARLDLGNAGYAHLQFLKDGSVDRDDFREVAAVDEVGEAQEVEVAKPTLAPAQWFVFEF